MSDEYQLYLTNTDLSIDKAKKYTTILKALFWQAGEQMGKLQSAIQKKPVDGFTFRMLIGTAYSILDCLDVAADYAKIGEHDGKGYTIYSKTKNIKLMKLYGERKTGNKETYDFEYFRFLRSFISAHPLDTNYENTVRGFLPGKYGFCKFV